MIALTQDMREKLIKDCEFDIERLTSLISEFPEETALQSVLLRQKVALASLMAETIGWGLRSLKDSGRFGSWLTSTPREQSYLDYQPHDYENVPLYTAPPVLEINKDDYIGLQVSVDVSTCDKDAGQRYFGRVSTITESKGEVVLMVEEPEKNFTAPLVPEIKFPQIVSRSEIAGNEVAREWFLRGCDWYEKEIKRLHGLGD